MIAANTTPERQAYSIQHKRVTRYFRVVDALVAGVLPLFFSVMTLAAVTDPQDGAALAWLIALGIIWVTVFACVVWLPPLQTNALKYWLDGSVLRIDQGVVFRKRKSIPLDRVTDVELAQGPLLWFCGIWVLNVQTAGRQQEPEGRLFGVDDPMAVRDAIMEAREGATRQRIDVGGE